jgi:ATP adenylyltransferase
MTFSELRDFLLKRMRMSHVYQPVMLKALLQSGGRASVQQIAQRLLAEDASQQEYYVAITKQMVGKVLASHGVVARQGQEFRLCDFERLTPDERAELISVCEERLSEFLGQRGDQVWNHRRKSSGYVPGTVRYEVLKRARFRCELCGVSAEVRALEVDHIVPRNRGGVDSIDNYQALCFTCNAQKRDRDATDFRTTHLTYGHRGEDCIFCSPPLKRRVMENELAYALWDGFPVTPLHCLVIPKRHALTYFDLGQPEVNACHRLLHAVRQQIERDDSSVSGFNIGMNSGVTAGQSVMHCHVHLIPRREGDVVTPRGGVRHVIPGKGAY